VSEPDKESSWINGRQLAFLLSLPGSTEGPFEIKFALHLPKWIPEQTMQLSLNGQVVTQYLPIEMDKGYWTQVIVDLEGWEMQPENNFVSVQFSNSRLPPGIEHFEVAAMIRSIRLVRKPASGTSKADASRP
jgi:hypothetical protein